MSFLPLEFAGFLEPNCNRFEYLKSWITKLEIPFTVLPIESKNHIFINFPKTCYSPLFKTKTLLVHYDRVQNTPGANDNSAAVCEVLLWAKKIYNQPKIHNLRIIFTDGEELGFTKELCDTEEKDLENISVRSYNALMRAGCKTIGQAITAINENKLPTVRNLGVKSIAEIPDGKVTL